MYITVRSLIQQHVLEVCLRLLAAALPTNNALHATLLAAWGAVACWCYHLMWGAVVCCCAASLAPDAAAAQAAYAHAMRISVCQHVQHAC